MKRFLHVILGAGGAIGTPLAQELVAAGERVRTVSRSGKGPEGADWRRADLLSADETLAAIEEGSTVYLLAGLPYDSRVWRVQWPVLMRNVVAACETRRARLLFLDNVYMYGAVDGPMTEETPVNPSSEKGSIRAEVAAYLLDEMKGGRIEALIARAADFYGPYAEATSVPYLLALKPLLSGGRPRWLVSASARHSYSYTLDCAKALSILAQNDDAFGQVWHLPTAHPALTGEEFMSIAARCLGVPLRYGILSKGMVNLVGLFNRRVYEVSRIIYQNDRDYLFDSTKFEQRFGFAPTPYPQGIEATIRFFRPARQR